MDKPYSLEACRSYCNDGQIYPAMAYKVDTEGKPKKQAGREVEDETDGAVTAGRAIQVYRRRVGGTDVPSKPKPKRLNKKQWDRLFRLVRLEQVTSGKKAVFKPPPLPDEWDYDQSVKRMIKLGNELEKLSPHIINNLIN